MKNVKCISCQSENVEFIYQGKTIFKKYRKVEGNLTEEGTLSAPTNEYLCLDCGCIMQVMEKANLQKYCKYKPYFIE